MTPGDPFAEEQSLPQEMLRTLNKQHGFDRSLFSQYLDYMFGLFKGDLGFSLKYPDRTIKEIIVEGFTISSQLGLQALLVAFFFGISFGIISAYKPHLWQNQLLLFFSILALSIPSFILATLLQYTLAIRFPFLPVARWGTFSQTILPTLTLAAAPMALIARLIRNELIEIFQTDYIKLAKAKGLPLRKIFLSHALKNACLPVLSYLGPLLANILVGSFIIEKIFSIPGLGQWFVNSIANRDYSLIMGLILFYSFILLTAVFIIDLLYGLVDPRIRIK